MTRLCLVLIAAAIPLCATQWRSATSPTATPLAPAAATVFQPLADYDVRPTSRGDLLTAILADSSIDDLPNAPQFIPVYFEQGPEFIRLCGGQIDEFPAAGPTMLMHDELPIKPIIGVDGQCAGADREPLWNQQRLIPWESFAYGEYIGPHRTPHVGTYRLRVNDQLEFTFFQIREPTGQPYRIFTGDILQITSSDADVNQSNLIVLSDGTISPRMIGRTPASGMSVEQLENLLNERYREHGIRNPEIVVQVTQSDTPLRDIRDAVDARQGSGGQSKLANVTPDGTVQLPVIDSVPALGLTLDELSREVNARYAQYARGLGVTARLTQPAPRFAYVMGEVNQPGQVPMTSPTTVMQAISQAGGWRQGANLRQVVVFRRDHDWRLVATRLNLNGALAGARPMPPDEIWLRDSDIVLVPKMPIQRLSELVDLYFTRTIYSAFRIQDFDFLFDSNTIITN